MLTPALALTQHPQIRFLPEPSTSRRHPRQCINTLSYSHKACQSVATATYNTNVSWFHSPPEALNSSPSWSMDCHQLKQQTTAHVLLNSQTDAQGPKVSIGCKILAELQGLPKTLPSSDLGPKCPIDISDLGRKSPLDASYLRHFGTQMLLLSSTVQFARVCLTLIPATREGR